MTHSPTTSAEKSMRGTLAWYGEQARLARLIHSGGDAGRHALQDDGGKRAREALSAALPPTPEPVADQGEGLTVEAYNALYDPADEAGRDTFRNGFREGFLFARFPEGYDADDADDAMREVDGVVMGESWEVYRDEFLRRLPIAAVPERTQIGKPLTTPPADQLDAEER